MNFCLLAKTILHIIFGLPGMATAGYPTEMAIMCFCLAGVPIIVVAFSGVVHRNESQVRMYLYYMWVVIAILSSLILWEFLFTGACGSLGGGILAGGAGRAWMCGMER